MKDGQYLECEVYYSKGGQTLAAMMGLSEGPEPRGYWLACRRFTVKDGFRSFVLGDGCKMFLKATATNAGRAASEARKEDPS